MLEHLKRGGRIEHYETQRLHQDGRRIDISLTVSPICDKTGRPIGISKIARDITARKRVEQEMQRADRLALVGQLASGLAHEIGTPLNVIAGNAEMLHHDLLAQGLEVAELETIVAQADRITRLMERFLAFARAREQPRTTKGEHGTGLGLAICRQIIDSHHGILRLDSVPGEGTTVTLILPRAEAPGQEAQG